MASVLITAFEPYDGWPANSSWLALVELTRQLPARPQVTTRLYPVDFDQLQGRLQDDLVADYDVVLSLGQTPGGAKINLERFGLNVAGHTGQVPESFEPLVPGGPAAYQSELPLCEFARSMQLAGIPAQVSYHAGTYLCNATMYLLHHLCDQMGLKTQATFIHVPLAVSQVLDRGDDLPSLTSSAAAQAIALILEWVASRENLV